mmetsp:Transcript_2128/g.5391  ORF Transcript_2128/g.5391 Transcript_2128/m.5391 type:complete len:237 (-) Transcript_2128:261-971(-)
MLPTRRMMVNLISGRTEDFDVTVPEGSKHVALVRQHSGNWVWRWDRTLGLQRRKVDASDALLVSDPEAVVQDLYSCHHAPGYIYWLSMRLESPHLLVRRPQPHCSVIRPRDEYARVHRDAANCLSMSVQSIRHHWLLAPTLDLTTPQPCKEPLRRAVVVHGVDVAGHVDWRAILHQLYGSRGRRLPAPKKQLAIAASGVDLAICHNHAVDAIHVAHVFRHGVQFPQLRALAQDRPC